MSPRKRTALVAAATLLIAAAFLGLTEHGRRLIHRVVLEVGPKNARAWVLDQIKDQGLDGRPLLRLAITDPDPDLRWSALDRFLALGPPAAPDAPAMLAATGDPILWDRSSRDFGILICDPSPHGPPFAPDTIANMVPLTIGDAAIPFLIEALDETKDQRARWLLVYTLALFKEKLPDSSAPALARALRSDHIPTRYHAAEALLTKGAHRDIPLPILKEDLAADDPWRPGLALRILDRRRRTPRALVPALIEIAEGKSVHLPPIAAIPALGRTGIETQGKVLPCLLRCRSQTEDPELTEAATRALKILAPTR